MRRYLTYGLLLLLVFAYQPTTSVAQSRCTIKGTPQQDFLRGTDHRDWICGRGGNDFISGQGARDLLRGGPDNDTVVGGGGPDRLYGRGGNDKLFGVDGHGRDRLFGGPGHDQCFGEKLDHYRGCEIVRHSHSPEYPRQLAMALQRALAHAIGAANKHLCKQDPIIGVCIGIGGQI